MNCLQGRYCAQLAAGVPPRFIHHAEYENSNLERQFPESPPAHLLRWLETNPVDVLCLQETKLPTINSRFPK
jgi:hypothetical protein